MNPVTQEFVEALLEAITTNREYGIEVMRPTNRNRP